MRILSLAILSVVVSAPAFAQTYDQHQGFEGGWLSDRVGHADERQARHGARHAELEGRHANRDVVFSDHHATAHAEQRARAEAHGVQAYPRGARHERRERHGNGYPDSH